MAKKHTAEPGANVMFRGQRVRPRRGAPLAQRATALARRQLISPRSPDPAAGVHAPLTSFVGRQIALAELGRTLAQPEIRLINLTGCGGTGKTRLALAAAVRAQSLFTDGICVVDLAPLANAGLVASTIACALGIRAPGGRSMIQCLRDHLSSRHLLLVLDNFEHVLDAAMFLPTLLSQCPRLTILTTSRTTLRVSGEHEYPVSPLALPDDVEPPDFQVLARSEAIALFVERARAVHPGFALTRENGAAIAQICRRLDGLPLALELAAAWIKVLPAAALAERLEGRLGTAEGADAGGFGLLVGGLRDAPARQQTLRATLDWSFGLLDSTEKTLFARLAVFADGCPLEAAEVVCGGAVVHVGSLLDKNLLRVADDPDGEPRLRMLETTREYGLEQLAILGELDTIRASHAAYFVERAERAEPELRGGAQGVWLGWFQTEHDNLRAVLTWSLRSGQTETALRLCGALARFWEFRGHAAEGERWLASALAAAPTPDASPRVRAMALNGAGRLAFIRGDYTHARAQHEASLGLWRELGDKRGTAQCLLNLALVATENGDPVQAVTWASECLALFRDVDHRWGVATALDCLGTALACQGDFTTARARLEESVALSRQTGRHRGVAAGLSNLADVARAQGDHAAAKHLLSESLGIVRELRDKWASAACLESLAAVACAQDQAEHAARLLGAAEGLRDAVDAVLPPAYRPEHERLVGTLGVQLGDETYASAWSRGRALTLDEAVEAALHEPGDSTSSGKGTGIEGRLVARRYRLAEVLGSGGTGTVYRAIDRRTGGAVAVKILHPALAGDVEYVERLRREAAIAASLTSPRLVRVTDFDEDGGTPFLVMEYVPGPTLQQVMEDAGRLPLAQVLAIGREIAHAIVAADKCGVVHRDLKPQNIKVLEGQVKVLDFGVARASGALGLTIPGLYLGTPYYSAPEQLDGGGDTRSDIYALGVILYQMVAGYLPFHAQTPLAVLRQHQIELPPPLADDVPPALQALIARCLAKDPDDRFQTPAQLASDLDAMQDDVSDATPAIDPRGSRVARASAAAAPPATLDLPVSGLAQPADSPTGELCCAGSGTRSNAATDGLELDRAFDAHQVVDGALIEDHTQHNPLTPTDVHLVHHSLVDGNVGHMNRQKRMGVQV